MLKLIQRHERTLVAGRAQRPAGLGYEITTTFFVEDQENFVARFCPSGIEVSMTRQSAVARLVGVA